jgi:plastocyanin
VLKITGFQFVPPRIHVAVGDTLAFVNEDIVPHAATAATGAWDSGTTAAKGRATLVIRAPGRVEYRCALHPTMKGMVVAEQNRAPSAMTARRAQREFSPLRLLQASLL